MTERELDQHKGELVRALRRRAAELDALDDAVVDAAAGTPSAVPTRTRPQPRVAYYARDTFRDAVLAGSDPIE